MSIIPIDVTTAGLIPDDSYTCTVQKLDLQIKTGEKWNKDGTTTVESIDEFNAVPQDKRRLHFTIAVPGHPSLFQDLYLMEKALFMVKNFMAAAGVEATKEGFDPHAAVGKQIGCKIVIESSPDYGDSNKISAFFKV